MKNSRDINITINPRTIVSSILFILLFVVLYVMRDLVLVVLTAVVIASSIEPVTRWFSKRKVSRAVSVILVYLAITLFFVGLFYSFLPTLLKDTSNLISQIPKYIDSVSLWNPLGSDLSQPKELAMGLSEGIVRSEKIVGDFSGNLSVQQAITNLSLALSNVSEGFLKTVSIVFGGVFSFFLIIILSFYLAVQEDGIEKFLRVVTPKEKEAYVIDLWKRVQMKIGYWLQGQLLLGVLVGVLVFLGLSVLGVRNALFFGVLAGIFELIPLFGATLAAIPAIAVAYIDGGVSLGLITMGLYLIIQQFENHLIYPLVVRKIVGVSPIMVILALIVGAKLAGFLGVILSVPVAAMIMEIFDDIEKSKVKNSEAKLKKKVISAKV